MSKIENGVFKIEAEKPQQCDSCGKIAELRPYGPGGSCICFVCGMKDEPGALSRFVALLDDVEGVDYGNE
ncbi:MAG: hypothetical protein KAI70_00765 [Candidatus Omnitrophica bacterium]|nr:hypothetical protein [Candidatus Omnitrophota bacterium]